MSVSEMRYLYVLACNKSGVTPCVALLNQLDASRQETLTQISIAHGSSGDTQIPPILSLLSASNYITGIALNYVELTDKGCVVLFRNLARNRAIVSLELFGNKIGDLSCQLIPQMLGNQTLTRLKLGDNLITSKGAEYIAKGLRNQSSLIQLHLGGNKIGDKGLNYLANSLTENSTLTSLGVRDNEIKSDGVLALVNLLCREECVLSEVQLKGNNIGDDGAEYLSQAMKNGHCAMRVLEVQGNNVGSKGATALCKSLHGNSSVHAINFNDNNLCDDGAEAIAALLESNTSITTVGVSGNNITERGASCIAKALKTNNTLTGLDLGNNYIGSDGISVLSDVLKDYNTSLMSLDVHMNDITINGFMSLTQALMINTTLRHLDVGSNYSRNQGAYLWAMVLETSTVLSRLCLTDNEIGREGGEVILQAIRRNKTLRNFQFGGQSTTRPFANRILPRTRRAINNVVAKNKMLWEKSERPQVQPNPNQIDVELEEVNEPQSPKLESEEIANISSPCSSNEMGDRPYSEAGYYTPGHSDNSLSRSSSNYTSSNFTPSPFSPQSSSSSPQDSRSLFGTPFFYYTPNNDEVPIHGLSEDGWNSNPISTPPRFATQPRGFPSTIPIHCSPFWGNPAPTVGPNFASSLTNMDRPRANCNNAHTGINKEADHSKRFTTTKFENKYPCQPHSESSTNNSPPTSLGADFATVVATLSSLGIDPRRP